MIQTKTMFLITFSNICMTSQNDIIDIISLVSYVLRKY